MMLIQYFCLAVVLLNACGRRESDTSGETPRPARPNIVLIMADDMGYGDLGCYGNTGISTPAIDALAAGGLMLTDYHSNGVVCSPTRASLLTGLYPQEAGVEGVITAKSHRHTGMSPEKYTLSEFLKEAGYRTALLGKWHLGYKPEFGPNVQGFDRFRGFVSGNVDYHSHIDQEGFADWWDNDQLQPEAGYLTDLITYHALTFMEESKGQPFFLYLAHGAPHYPYQTPDDPAIRSVGNPEENTASRPDLDRAHGAMIESLDANVGRVVSYLEKNGLMENTLIIFCSDNGANLKVGSNRPFRGGKGGVLEGGHRVPAIFYWKGTIRAGTSDHLMLSMDIFPTITSLLGTEPEKVRKFSGQSMIPLLTGQDQDIPDKERTVFWQVRSNQQKAARKGNWKMVRINGQDALYDLSKDLEESTDVRKEFPEIYNELKAALEQWESGLAN